MLVAWIVCIVATLAAGYVYWRMRPFTKALGPNLIDRTPRFRRHDLELVRSALERHKDLLAKHKKVATFDLWLAPLAAVALAAFVWGLAEWHRLGWLPVVIAIAAGVADQVENVFVRRILKAPHRSVPQREVTALAVATSAKYAGYALALLAAFWVVAFIR